jgi:hypothetical protein
LTLSKLFLLIGNKIFPFFALPVLILLWTRLGGKEFAILVLGLPFLFGYIAPGIGTNYLKMWRFRGSMVVGRYYLHHGFIYAAMLGLTMYIAFIPPAHGDWLTLLGNMARGAGLIGFIGWTHDTIAIREGEMEVYSREWKRGAAPEVIAAHYAPLAFSALGACYAGVITLGYQTLVLEQDINSLWWLFPLGLAILCASISLPFLTWIKEVIHEKVQGS